MRVRLTKIIMPLLLAVGAIVVTASLAFAYPPPPTTGTSSGCTADASGSSCVLSFTFTDSQGNPAPNSLVCYTVGGVGGTVNPTCNQTNAQGVAGTTFTAPSNCTKNGNATVTAQSGNASVTTTIAITGCGSGVPLPNTGAPAPGPSPLIYGGVLLAVLVLVGGAITLRQTRRSV